MTGTDALFSHPPFSLSALEKEALLMPAFLELTRHHQKTCAAYDAMLRTLGYEEKACRQLSDLPFLPVGLFKRLTLAGVSGEDARVLTSSGTSGQSLSRILVDGETALLQRQALACIAGDVLGPKRLPMLVLDTPAVLRPPLNKAARGAGVLGFSVCASRRFFAFREDMSPDTEGIEAFLVELGGKPFFLFGLTYLIWKHFYMALQQLPRRLDLSGGTLIHGGGWKKLAGESVSREKFHASLTEACGLVRIYDYYGMAEQTGSVFLECEYGHFHCSNFSQAFMRRSADFSLCGTGEEGIVQVLSALPRSYPGHNLLTEDRGVLLGEDDCPCGRKGKYFTVIGRLPDAELRGCSDVYE